VDPRQEPLSPELALVDPALAEAARAALPAEPWKAFLPAPPPAPMAVAAPAAPAAAPVAEAPLRWPDEAAAEPVARPRQRSRRLLVTVAFATAAVAGVVVGGDFIGPRAADRPSFAPDGDAAGTTGTMTAERPQTPSVSPPVTPAAPPATTGEQQTTSTPSTTAKPKPPAPTRKPKAKPKKTKPAFVPARVFAWGPVKGATTYRVRFYRGTRLVLQRTTKTARIELPRSFEFAKGSYRWVVEPKVGAKYGNAVVDSKFTIP
jgi:hypothetical protein